MKFQDFFWCSSGDSNSGFLSRFAQKAFLFYSYRLAARAATADIVFVSGVRYPVNGRKKDGQSTVFFLVLQRRFELRLFIALRAKSLLILFLSARRQGGNRRYRICVRSSIPCKRQKKRRSVDRLFSGAPAEIRTPDTLLKRQVLCLLSYWGIS